MTVRKMTTTAIRENLVAIRAICENAEIDDDNARGMSSLIATTLEGQIKMMEGEQR